MGISFKHQRLYKVYHVYPYSKWARVTIILGCHDYVLLQLFDRKCWRGSTTWRKHVNGKNRGRWFGFHGAQRNLFNFIVWGHAGTNLNELHSYPGWRFTQEMMLFHIEIGTLKTPCHRWWCIIVPSPSSSSVASKHENISFLRSWQ